MARKVKDVTITLEGRDKGKIFRITEMPASEAELWAGRVFLALLRSGADVPDDVASMGMAGIAVMGFRAFGGIKFEELVILMNDMFRCVVAVPDRNKPDFTRAPIENVDSDIEEVATRLFLRNEVFELHTGFSVAGTLLGSNRKSIPESSPATSTSQPPSGQSSHRASPRSRN